MIRLAIFASGSGSNTERIIESFKNDSKVKVEVVLSNKSDAFVLERARKHNIQVKFFSKSKFEEESFLETLKVYKVDYLILAGFLLKVPDYLIQAYPDKILNIHPSLLPKYGGRGMYGSRVHETVIASGDKVSGITIHLVNEHYDEGRVLFQAECSIDDGDTSSSLVKKIQALEHKHFPRVIREYVMS